MEKQGLFSRVMRLVPAAAVVLFGLVISAYPHFLELARHRRIAWVADKDELGLYLLIAAKSYWNNPLAVSDPVSPGQAPIKYPWLQFAPFSAAARALALPVESVSLLWRIFAGVSIAFGWLVLMRTLFPHGAFAYACAALLLGDAGLLEAKLAGKQCALLAGLLRHPAEWFASKPLFHAEWRIISPGLALGLLLLFYAAYLRNRASASRWAFLVPGLLGGLLFHTYFYYWTAVGLGMLLSLVFLPAERRYLLGISGLALLLGAPEIAKGLWIKSHTNPDWLPRSDKFLPIGHFSELIVPKAGLLLLGLGIFFFWKKRAELRFFFLQAAAGLLLLNHQAVTGLQIENFHWSYHWGPTLSLALVAAVGPGVQGILARGGRGVRLAALALLCAHLGGSLALRHLEVSRSRDPLALNAFLHADLPAAPGESSVVAGDPWLVEAFCIRRNQIPLDGYSATLSPQVSDQEWHERIALNALLRGRTEADFLAEQRQLMASWVWGPWTRKPGGLDGLLEERMAAYRRVAAAPARMIARYKVRLLLTHPEKPLPYRELGSAGPYTLFALD